MQYEFSLFFRVVCLTEKIRAMPFVRDYESFHDTLGNADANEGSTMLYDAIKKAGEVILEYVKSNAHLLSSVDEPCKYRIFALTDGEDNASKTPYWQVAKFLQDNNIILDSVPVGVRNDNLHVMSVATGGICLHVNDMEKGVALFEREAILHLHSRPAPEAPPPKIIDAQTLETLKASGTTKHLVEDIKSAPSPAVVNQKVIKKEDLTKIESTIDQKPSTAGGASIKRIFKEYRDLMTTPVPNWTPFIAADDTTLWKIIMEGPAGTPYEKGRWIVTFKFPTDYPFKPPQVRFATPIYHCNINNDGKLCLDILRDCWSPALTAGKVFQTITELLITPNPLDALDSVKANVYSDNKENYNRLAAEHTQTHATTPLDELKKAYSIED